MTFVKLNEDAACKIHSWKGESHCFGKKSQNMTNFYITGIVGQQLCQECQVGYDDSQYGPQ